MLDKIPVLGKGMARLLHSAKKLVKTMAGPGVFFESIGYKYLGPVDGHNIERLCSVFEEAKKSDSSVIIHTITTKGKGYAPAENNPSAYHATSPVSPASTHKSTSAAFGEALMKIAEKEDKVISISPSMPASCGLSGFTQKYPDRFFDTGISEGHAVTFAAGLAAGGYIPVVSVYSTFLQRAYDSLVHDVAIGNYHVVIGVDRAGAVGEDGETHQGLFDLSYLSSIPNMTVLSPADNDELSKMLEFAILKMSSPVAIRFPKGTLPSLERPPFELQRADTILTGTHVTIAAEGKMVHTALECAQILKEKNISAEVINLRTIKPLDIDTLLSSAQKTGLVVTIENNVKSGGVGEKISAAFTERGINIPVIIKAFPDKFIPHGTTVQLMEKYNLNAYKIANEIEGRVLP